MNINEECLLLFLNNPKRLESTTKELKKLIFPANSNIIVSKEINKKSLSLENA